MFNTVFFFKCIDKILFKYEDIETKEHIFFLYVAEMFNETFRNKTGLYQDKPHLNREDLYLIFPPLLYRIMQIFAYGFLFPGGSNSGFADS